MTSARNHYLLYGLRIDSELPLYQQRPIASDVPADVTIRVGSATPVNGSRPAGRLLLELERERRIYSAAARDDGGWMFRCYGVCDFDVDANLQDVTVHHVATAEPGLASVLAVGTLLSFILTMRGDLVVHASAVQVQRSIVAFVGATGMGKSTIATLMCAEGATLVTDDVLRLDLNGPQAAVSCHLGTNEVRLRKPASGLVARFDGTAAVRRTADARDALQLPSADDRQRPLAAIVVPFPDHDSSRRTADFERLDRQAALLTMLRFPRLLGWQDRATIRRHFHQLGEVVERVPVYVARLPWGPPFPTGLAASILEAVDIHPSSTVLGRRRRQAGLSGAK